MNREDIKRMAREADLFEHVPLTGHVSFIYDLMEFAALVAAAEQDRCCKIIYSMAGSDNVAQRTVDAIRSNP